MSTTGARNEGLLGLAPSVIPDDAEDEWTSTHYVLNLFDGWRRHTDHSHDGITWAYETSRRSHVRAVLDRAPDAAEFIARAHLHWTKTLAAAGQRDRANRQRRALAAALANHGLTLKPDRGTDENDPAQSQHQPQTVGERPGETIQLFSPQG